MWCTPMFSLFTFPQILFNILPHTPDCLFDCSILKRKNICIVWFRIYKNDQIRVNPRGTPKVCFLLFIQSCQHLLRNGPHWHWLQWPLQLPKRCPNPRPPLPLAQNCFIFHFCFRLWHILGMGTCHMFQRCWVVWKRNLYSLADNLWFLSIKPLNPIGPERYRFAKLREEARHFLQLFEMKTGQRSPGGHPLAREESGCDFVLFSVPIGHLRGLGFGPPSQAAAGCAGPPFRGWGLRPVTNTLFELEAASNQGNVLVTILNKTKGFLIMFFSLSIFKNFFFAGAFLIDK